MEVVTRADLLGRDCVGDGGRCPDHLKPGVLRPSNVNATVFRHSVVAHPTEAAPIAAAQSTPDKRDHRAERDRSAEEKHTFTASLRECVESLSALVPC